MRKAIAAQAVALIAPAAIIAITVAGKTTTIITTTTITITTIAAIAMAVTMVVVYCLAALPELRERRAKILVEGTSNRISTVLMTQTKTPSFCVNKFGHRHEQGLQDDLASLFFVLRVELSDQEHLFYVRICYFGQRSLERFPKMLSRFSDKKRGNSKKLEPSRLPSIGNGSSPRCFGTRPGGQRIFVHRGR